VGVLIKNSKFDGKFEISNTQSTLDGNALILKVKIDGKFFQLVSIYGPNHDTELDFYDTLSVFLRSNNCPIIMGGDWNATFDDSVVGTNLDVVNMRNIPSIRRTNKIREICATFSLIEPFRNSFPYKKDYTYIPSALNANNRSRLDYFLISSSLINQSTRCTIPHCLTSTLFDHKPVNLSINAKNKPNRNMIKDTVLRNPDLPIHVKIAVMECYLQHWVPGINTDGTVTDRELVERYLLSIGRISGMLTEIQEIEIRIALNGQNNIDELTIAARRGEIRLILEDMPDLAFFENLSVSHTPSLFLKHWLTVLKTTSCPTRPLFLSTKTSKKPHS